MFEGPISTTETKDNDKEVKKEITDRLTKKYPKLRLAIIALIGIMSTFGNQESKQEETPTNPNITMMDFDRAIEKLDDPRIMEMIQDTRKDFVDRQNEIPADTIFSNRTLHQAVGADYIFNEETTGELPAMISGVQIGNHSKLLTQESSANNKATIADTMATTFYVAPSKEKIEKAGDPITFKGHGENLSQAIQMALEEATKFLGLRVEAQDKIKSHQTGDPSGEGDSRSLNESIETSAAHPIESYLVTNIKGGEGEGAVEVSVSIQPGVLAPEQPITAINLDK